MNQIINLKEWVAQQWSTSNLGDLRRNQRAITLAQQIINKPYSSLSSQTGNWASLKAAYRLLNSDEVTHASLQEEHRKNVKELAINEQGTVLFIQDTSELDYSSKKAVMGLGPIGNHEGLGIMIHSCLAISYNANATNILGLAHQVTWTRYPGQAYRKTENRKQRLARPNEGDIWENTLELIQKPKDCISQWVSIGDRSNDVFSFIKYCNDNVWDYVIRAKHNRKILNRDGSKIGLHEWARTLSAKTTKLLQTKQQAIELQVSWDQVTIITPKNSKKDVYEEITAYVIRCWDTTSNLEWILLTNIPVTNDSEALEKIRWYESRWLIEEYHKCLKTGCSIEKSQLKTVDRLKALLGFIAIIATQLLQIKFFARSHPQELAQDHIPKEYLKVFSLRFNIPQQKITIKQFWHKIAGLGGFLGRKSDGDPGWQTLWSGWMQFLDMVRWTSLCY